MPYFGGICRSFLQVIAAPIFAQFVIEQKVLSLRLGLVKSNLHGGVSCDSLLVIRLIGQISLLILSIPQYNVAFDSNLADVGPNEIWRNSLSINRLQHATTTVTCQV